MSQSVIAAITLPDESALYTRAMKIHEEIFL